MGFKKIGFGCTAALWIAAGCFAVDNPLSISLDGSMVRYNGEYYGMGAQTNGQMWTSENLVDWTSPAVVLEPEFTGSYELLYRNGLFYLYVQEMGYAVSANPQGPYSTIRKLEGSGADLRLFQDKSGLLLSVDRQIGGKQEGEVWIRSHGAPWKTGARPGKLLSGRRGMWDSLDSADLGEPEILDYRGNYYLLYSANHPGPRTGLREIGVAMNENPVHFNNADKLPEPVLMRNVDRLARTYKAIVPSGEYTEWEGRYTFTRPENGWTQPGFKAVGWRTGSGGFGYPFEDGGAQIHAARTEWSTGQIWVRREFDLPDGVPQSPVLNIRYEGNVQVFLNGKKVFESAHSSPAYSNFDLAEVARGAFRPKGNVLAVRALASRRAPFRFLDFGLFDAGDHPVEPTVYGLSAPRIVTGPNGFEKWLIYRAYWNGVPGTGIDRVFFFDDEMVIDGPTTASTKGYHPLPVRPSFSDLFGPREDPAWTFSGSDWAVVDGVMRQTKAKGLFKAYLQGPPSSHYLFEANIRFPSDGKGAVGVVAYSDGKHDLVIGINPVERTWSYGLEPGNRAPNRFKLPEQFQLLEGPPGSDTGAAPLHLLRVTKNGGDFEVMLDEFKLTSKNPIATKLTGAGVPGLYCQDSAAEFDGVVYTMGWDEYDEYITGWGAAADGTSPGGEWKHLKEDGLKQMRHFGPGHIFKGDLLDQYEFTVNARTEGKPEESQKQLYGVFPVFIDQDNYLKAVIDIRNRELVVSGKRDGKGIGPFTRSLARRIPHRHLYDKSISYRDIAAWVYSLRSESRITALEIRWLEGEYDHLHQEFFVPTDEITIRHAKLPRGREPLLWDDGRFREADEPKPRLQESGILNPIDIRPVLGSHIGFGISITLASGSEDYLPDTLSRPQETLITVEVESSYFFRCVKLKDRVVIELNGHPMLEVAGEWPPSQVGLVTEGQPCFYNGIMLMHLPGE